TLGRISRNSANVASVHQPIMGAVRVGAWLAPVLGVSHRPILRSRGCVIHTYRMVGLFSFSKYYRVSTEHFGTREIAVKGEVARDVARDGIIDQLDAQRRMIFECRCGTRITLLKPTPLDRIVRSRRTDVVGDQI